MVDSVIEIKNLSRSFGKKIALSNINLSVPAGCVFGLVGENGAGKTTLLKHVLGMLKVKSGDVSVFGKNPVADPVSVLSRIGHLSEDRAIPGWMKVEDVLSFTKSFYKKWDSSFADELKELFALDAKQRVRTLSRGQKARLGLLAALAHRPDLLVLDEPSSGLDPSVRQDILAAIIRTVADEGRTVLFSSHLLDEVQRVSDRVAMLHEGKLVLSDELDTILASHHRITVRFPNVVNKPNFSAAIGVSGHGREWLVICNGQQQLLEKEIQSLDGEIVDRDSPSLDEIFLARCKTSSKSEVTQ